MMANDPQIHIPTLAQYTKWLDQQDAMAPRGRSPLAHIYQKWAMQIVTSAPGTPVDDPDPRYSVYSVGVDLTWTPTVPAPIAGTGGVRIIAPPVADPYPDLRPRVPVQYSQSPRARQRSAVFTGKVGGCLRCGRDLTGQPVVNVAPATLPPATVHVGCVEVDDQIGAKDE